MTTREELLKKTLAAAEEGNKKLIEDSAPKYLNDNGREVVKAILESVVDEGRWASIGPKRRDIDKMKVSKAGDVDKVMDNLNGLSQGEPLEISLVSKSLDIIANIRIDQDGKIISAKPNDVAPKSYGLDDMYDDIIGSAEKKLGKPVEGYETFNYDQRESFVKTSEGYTFVPIASFNDYSFGG